MLPSMYYWFFGLIIVLFVIVLAFTLISLKRTGSYEHRRHRIPGAPAIDERKEAERLGEQQAGQYGQDPRGVDIGGTFSNTEPDSRSGKTASTPLEERRRRS
ncbi:MAG: hypothetical protein IMW89_22170 [Ktedonobacteraceae bacterium]|nr:hypothetical protein [Ktedonobacteraceae bacterium]